MERVAQANSPTFVGSRWKAGLGAVASLGLVLLGWWFTESPATVRHSTTYYDVLGWLLIGLSGLGALAFLVSLLIPQRLWLERDGFSFQRAWTRKKHYRWGDIDEIWVHYQRASGSIVWKNKYPNGGILRSTFGFDGWLPGAWTTSAEELASELRLAKAHHDDATKC
jgi:hypothetical protein